MYTIKEVSRILGISPQAVYKKLNQFNKQLGNELKEVEKNGKLVKVVTDKGLEILKGTVEQPRLETDDKQLNNLLNETITMLSHQLEVKDKQIQELNDRLREQQELNRNNQVLLRNEQQKALPSGTTWERIKGVFKRDNQEE